MSEFCNSDTPIGAPYHNNGLCPIGDKVTKPTKELLEIVALLWEGIYSIDESTGIKRGNNEKFLETIPKVPL